MAVLLMVVYTLEVLCLLVLVMLKLTLTCSSNLCIRAVDSASARLKGAMVLEPEHC